MEVLCAELKNRCIALSKREFIGGMLSHLDESNSEVTKERVLDIFEDAVKAEGAEEDSDLTTDRHLIFIKNPAYFNLIVGCVSGGDSFLMDSRFLQMTKEHVGLASTGSVSKGKSSGHTRFVCALNIQKIFEIMGSSWAISLDMYMSTHMQTSSLEILLQCLVVVRSAPSTC